MSGGGPRHLSHGGNAYKAVEPPIVECEPGDFRTRYVARNRPVAIRGLVRHWPAIQRWTAGYLADFAARSGDLEVPYRSTPEGQTRMDLSRIYRGQTSLHGLLRACQADPGGPELYVPGISLPPHAGLMRDLEEPELLTSFRTFGTTVFLGRNTRCIGHFHPKAQALLCQVQGIKRVWMFPPSELGRLHLFPVWSPSFYQSSANFYGDLAAFPGVPWARGRMYELHPGDALFIPQHWLHVPEGKGWTAAVTYWWRPGAGEWLRSAGSLRALAGVGAELARRAFARPS